MKNCELRVSVAVTVILASFALAAASKPAKVEAKPTLRGLVRAIDGKPIEGATVLVVAAPQGSAFPRFLSEAPGTPTRVMTTKDGTFEAPLSKDKEFSVRVDAPALAPWTGGKIPAGASIQVTLRRGEKATGQVIDRETSRPLPGATVYACDQDSSPFGRAGCRQTRSGEDGGFVFANLAPGFVRFEALSPRHALARSGDLTIRAPQPGKEVKPAEATLYLGPGGRLSGRVTSQDGKPIEGARVSFQADSGDVMELLRDPSMSRADLTDAEGRFAFDGLPAGRAYRVRAAKKGFSTGEAGPVAVEKGTDRSDIVVRLEPETTLRVRLATAEGVAVAALDVEARRSEPDARGLMGFARSGVPRDAVEALGNGTFRVHLAQAGTYRILLQPEGYDEIERDGVKLRPGEEVDLGSLVVREGRTLSGRVLDALGAPIEGASARVSWGERASRRARTAKTRSGGEYRVGGLPDGPSLNVNFTAEGYLDAKKENFRPDGSPLDMVLERAAAITGKVTLPDGKPPAAFRVRAQAEASPATSGLEKLQAQMFEEPKVFVDPAGLFRLDGIEPGTYTVEATAEKLAPGRRTGIQIAAEQVVDVGTLVLERGMTVRGRVIDARSEAPVAGAAVFLNTQQLFGALGARSREPGIMTDVDGRFTVEGVGTGSYTLAVQHPDYARATTRVQVEKDQDPPEIAVQLSKGGNLTGRVRDAQKQPIAGTTLTVTEGFADIGNMRTATTDEAGRYTVERLSPGSYMVMRAPNPGSGSLAGFGMKNVTIRDGETSVLDFDESPPITLSGRVLRAGKPVPGAMLMFVAGESSSPGDFKASEADGEGRYRVGLDRGGPYQVMVRGGGLEGSQASSTLRITVPASGEASIDLVLAAAGIAGTVRGPEGRPLEGVSVGAVRDAAAGSDPGSRAAASTGSDGQYSLDNLAPGTYRVVASAAGYKSAETYPVTVSEDSGMTQVDLALERGLTLKGRLVDHQGVGIPGALVLVAPSGRAPASSGMPATTDVNGAFAVTAPSDEAVDITLLAGGWAPARATGIVPSADPDASAVVLQASLGGTIRAVVRRSDGTPSSGVQLTLGAVPPFLGSEWYQFVKRPQATGPDGTTRMDLLCPGSYQVGIAGRNDIAPVSVVVAVGSEVVVEITLP